MLTESPTAAKNSAPANDSTQRPRVRKKLPVINKNYQPPEWSWHRWRRIIHVVCVLVFIALPFFNVIRFDIPRQRFYIAGFELWINEFAIIFFSLLFLMFIVAAISMLYGRVYCGYLCPQMIFSEAATNLQEALKTFINKHFAKVGQATRARMVQFVTYAALVVGSVFLAFVFISYFVEPRDLLSRLVSLDVVTAGGFAGAVVTLITFLDFAFLKQKFCTTVCPYGYLQGILGDDNTLVIHYRDPEEICVECKKCVRVCHMGIDIRDSPYQIECIHCGECVDACDAIMGKFGKETLIRYAWGEKGELLGGGNVPWYKRIGLRDLKRVGVFALIMIYGTSLAIALTTRHNVLVQIAPNRATLYRQGDDGRVYNSFRMTLANRGKTDTHVTLAIDGLPDAAFASANEYDIKAGESLQTEFEISVPNGRLEEQVNHFRFKSAASPEGTSDEFEQTFIAK